MGHLNISAGPRGFLIEDARATMGLGNLRWGGQSFREARPKWPFTVFSLLGSSEGRLCACVLGYLKEDAGEESQKLTKVCEPSFSRVWTLLETEGKYRGTRRV